MSEKKKQKRRKAEASTTGNILWVSNKNQIHEAKLVRSPAKPKEKKKG